MVVKRSPPPCFATQTLHSTRLHFTSTRSGPPSPLSSVFVPPMSRAAEVCCREALCRRGFRPPNLPVSRVTHRNGRSNVSRGDFWSNNSRSVLSLTSSPANFHRITTPKMTVSTSDTPADIDVSAPIPMQQRQELNSCFGLPSDCSLACSALQARYRAHS
jgi:hypothetical protein